MQKKITMTDKVQKIKEFLIGMASAACCDAKTKKNIETIILPFVDSLQEEPISEDLEKAAKVQETIETAIHHAYHNGRLEMKEQIMAKAKSGTVQKDNQVILDDETYIDLDPSMQLKPSFAGLKEGDRIKVIIIKED